MVTVFSSGLMEGNIKDIGRMENNMVKESTSDLMGKREKENGKRERESSGLRKMEKNNSEREQSNSLITLSYVHHYYYFLFFSALLPAEVNHSMVIYAG